MTADLDRRITPARPDLAAAYLKGKVDAARYVEGKGYGIAVGEDTKEAAQKAAVKYCKEHGNSNCKSVVWFKQCGAYAASKKYYGYGYGATKAIASRKALDMCAHESCKVAVAECED